MENKKILFNIAVHESIDAVNDLIDSILWSYEYSYVVLHVNANWNDFDEKKLKYLNDKVFVNNTRFPLEKFYGLGGILILNINYFNTLNIDYDYVVLASSNELYVKKIDIKYIESSKFGSEYYPIPQDYDERKFIKISKELEKISSSNGMYHGFFEGTFFEKNIANQMVSIYLKHFGTNPTYTQVDEENLLPTILYNIVKWEKTESLCLFHHEPNVNFEKIKSLIDNTLIKKFSIKRVDRFDFSLRNQIKELRNNFK